MMMMGFSKLMVFLTIYASSVSYIAKGLKWTIPEIVNVPQLIVHNCRTTPTTDLSFYPLNQQVYGATTAKTISSDHHKGGT
jgi:hypothetical protein